MGKPSAPQPAPVDTTVRADPAGMGEFDRPGNQCLCHPFDAPNEGGADLKNTCNLRAVQLLLGHTKMDNTVRYRGADLDDALTLSEGVDL